jgi:hypothetical protein
MIAGTDRLKPTSDVGLFPLSLGGPLPPPGAASATALAANVNQIADLRFFDVMSLSLSYRSLSMLVTRARSTAVERRPCFLLLLLTSSSFVTPYR